MDPLRPSLPRSTRTRRAGPRRARRALLAGLTAAASGASGAAWADEAPSAPATVAQAASAAPAASAPASSRGTELAPVQVRGARNRPTAAVGKGEEAIREVPQSVTTLTSERIEQQALQTLDDAMLKVTGVTREQLWLNNNYYARGLKIESIRYDGGAVSTVTDRNNSADLAQFEELSVLRGVDGLFGAGDAGGVINFKSKRPLDTPAVEASFSLARWNNYRLMVDASTPLSETNELGVRVVGVVQDQDHFYKPTHSRRKMLYGALQARPTPDTTLLVGASLQQDHQSAFNASLMRYVDGADAQFPRSATMGSPDGWLDRENFVVFANLGQRLGPRWALNANLRRNAGDDKINGAELEDAISYTTRQSTWWVYQDATREDETTVDVNLQGSFDAFGRAHDVIVGLDGTHRDRHYLQNWIRYGPGDAFDRVAPPLLPDPPAAWATDTRTVTRTTSVYGSLRFRPIDRLALIVGGRKTLNESQTIDNRATGNRDDFPLGDAQNDKFIPYFGAVYELTPTTSVYASRAEIFKSQLNNLSALRGPSLEPATGSNLEVGLKSELFDRRALFTAALFEVKKEKEAVLINWDPTGRNSWCCYTATGDKSSRGVELELQGRVTPNWELSAGYTFNSNKNRRSNDARFSTITPRHLLKVWSNHLLGGWVPGLSVGAGVSAQSKSYVSGSVRTYNPATGEYDGAWQDYTFNQASHAIWSLRAAYDIDPHWSLALNVNNLFDKHYYSTVGNSGYGNFYGEPLNAILTLTARF